MAEKIGEDMITQGIKIKRPAIPTKVCGNNYLFILSLCFILFVFSPFWPENLEAV